MDPVCAFYLTRTSSGVQHKVRILVLERRRYRQDLHTALRHRHRIRGSGWRHFCRKPYSKLQRRLVRQLDSICIWHDYRTVSCDFLVRRLQQCLQRGERGQGESSVYPKVMLQKKSD